MQFICRCGERIPDQTDYLPYKAHLIADQDFYDVLEQLELVLTGMETPPRENVLDIAESLRRAMDEVSRIFLKYTRSIYQCSGCGRLWLADRAQDIQSFTPDDSESVAQILRSVEGDNWKRPLRGQWRSWSRDARKGELHWGFGDAEQGFEQFESWDGLHQRYFEVFERLRAKNILRDALLKRGDEVVHVWSPLSSGKPPN